MIKKIFNLKELFRKGFTLIELAIVLVIIGLLVSGILAGQELIKQAKLSNLTTQIKEYETSSLTFFTKYNGIPGDLKNAEKFGLQNSGSTINASTTVNSTNGNGDRKICDSSGSFDTPDGEFINYWLHLSNAGLVKGKFTYDENDCNGFPCFEYYGTGFPQTNDGLGISAHSANQKIYFIYGNRESLITGIQDITKSATTESSYYIDQKVDNGDPSSGTVRAISALATGSDDGITFESASPSGCFNNNSYNLNLKTKVCAISILTNL